MNLNGGWRGGGAFEMSFKGKILQEIGNWTES